MQQHYMRRSKLSDKQTQERCQKNAYQQWTKLTEWLQRCIHVRWFQHENLSRWERQAGQSLKLHWNLFNMICRWLRDKNGNVRHRVWITTKRTTGASEYCTTQTEDKRNITQMPQSNSMKSQKNTTEHRHKSATLTIWNRKSTVPIIQVRQLLYCELETTSLS